MTKSFAKSMKTRRVGLNARSKSNTITLDCFTTIPSAFEFAKIDYATKFIPDWWKKTPIIQSFKEEDGSDAAAPTIKNCRGLIDHFRTGIVIPSWFDGEFQIHGKNSERFSDGFTFHTSNQIAASILGVNSHDWYQYKDFCGEWGRNIKINSPWRLKTKEDIMWNWTQPTWNMRTSFLDWTLLPAVVSYKYQSATNISYFATHDDEDKIIKVPALTPLVMLHPMTEKKIEIKTHLIDDREHERLFGIELLINRTEIKKAAQQYTSKKKLIDRIEDSQTGKCPFGHE